MGNVRLGPCAQKSVPPNGPHSERRIGVGPLCGIAVACGEPSHGLPTTSLLIAGSNGGISASVWTGHLLRAEMPAWPTHWPGDIAGQDHLPHDDR